MPDTDLRYICELNPETGNWDEAPLTILQEYEALVDSFFHWLDMWDDVRNNREELSSEPYAQGCACCIMTGYAASDDEDDCGKCPIAQHVAKYGCRGTPYNKAASAIDAYMFGEKFEIKDIEAEIKFLGDLAWEYCEALQ